MAVTNSSFTFMDVVNGVANAYFSASRDSGYSEGVKTLQNYLKQIGYIITDASGRFQNSTKSAVIGFQREMGITQDGGAGTDTCKRLNVVHTSEYFTTYGKPITGAQWGVANILAGKFGDVDLLARVLIAESGYNNINDQRGVAIVIKNRADSTNESYWESPEVYPNASIYARVIGKGGQYGVAEAGVENAERPMRGYKATAAQGYINAGWKNAVELGKDVVDGTKIAVAGYVVTGTEIDGDWMRAINSVENKEYLNQKRWDSYVTAYKNNNVSPDVLPMTFSTAKDCNVIFEWQN